MPSDIYALHTYTYLHLRKAVGWIGVLLPFVLVLGTYLIFNDKVIQPSISHYYHTGMSDVFVGVICAIALFMFYYCGPEKIDNICGDIAGFSAVGIALFPTTKEGAADWVGVVHYSCAAVFFLTLAFFAIWLFRKTKKGEEPTPQKKKRNMIYLICGIIMIACLLAIVIYHNFLKVDGQDTILVFVAETIALIAFGFSWMVKGEVILADD